MVRDINKDLPLPAFNIDYTVEENSKYLEYYLSCSPQNGLVFGNDARDIFLKSKLPVETLGQIWSLVDPDGSGKIDKIRFLLSLSIITNLKKGTLASCPTTIPSQLLAAIKSMNSSAPSSPPQILRKASKMSVTSSVYENLTPDLSEADRQSYHAFFKTLDTDKKDYLTGAESYAFFVKSGLSASDLAQIWSCI